MRFVTAVLAGLGIAAVIIVLLCFYLEWVNSSLAERRARKLAEDCHRGGYRTATVRCHGTGTPFDAAGGVRDRCVMVSTGYRMDGQTVEAGKWSLPRASCSVEWAR